MQDTMLYIILLIPSVTLAYVFTSPFHLTQQSWLIMQNGPRIPLQGISFSFSTCGPGTLLAIPGDFTVLPSFGIESFVMQIEPVNGSLELIWTKHHQGFEMVFSSKLFDGRPHYLSMYSRLVENRNFPQHEVYLTVDDDLFKLDDSILDLDLSIHRQFFHSTNASLNSDICIQLGAAFSTYPDYLTHALPDLLPCTFEEIMTCTERSIALCNIEGYQKNCVHGNCTELSSSNDTYCSCDSGYFGELCQCSEEESTEQCNANTTKCDVNPCKNSAVCSLSDEDPRFHCNCSGTGFTGELCSQDLDECQKETICPAESLCINYYGGYQCICKEGFYGEYCNITTCSDEFDNWCPSTAECLSGDFDWHCNCSEGSSGQRCEYSKCSVDNSCTGTSQECLIIDEQTVCQCDKYSIGFPNYDVECISFDPCSTTPCKNSGGCHSTDDHNFTCKCRNGFVGDLCETNIDDCIDNPCENNATCFDQIASYYCYCTPGFHGINCSNSVDYCNSNSSPCSDHGDCVNDFFGFECKCRPQYTGFYCQSDVDECTVFSPCANDAECENLEGEVGYSCKCVAGWTGTNCTESVDNCVDVGCKNGGTCKDLHNDFKCECPEEYMGVYCEKELDVCLRDNPCGSRGECIPEKGTPNFQCNCFEKYNSSSPTCEDLNECDVTPDLCPSSQVCYNKLPSDNANGYICDCQEGYEPFPNCTDDIDECEETQKHKYCVNGECTNFVGGYNCSCFNGYTGRTCNEQINHCDGVTCQHGGICNSKVGGYECLCRQQFTGDNCENAKDLCEENKCEHGECISDVGTFECKCETGYTGELCNEEIDECAGKPCLHGECIDLVGDYKCNCTIGYTGIHCQAELNHCLEKPCANGGLCQPRFNGFDCVCAGTGFTGLTCTEHIDDCKDIKCDHGGVCQDGINTFQCKCYDAYYGKLCQNDFPECNINPCQNAGVCLERSKTANYPKYIDLFGHTFSFENADGYACLCASPYEGVNCTDLHDWCDPWPCGDFGSDCTSEFTDFKCNCKDGFSGDTCEVNIDDCKDNPCKNTATCTDLVNAYKCNCIDGYSGVNCEIKLTKCDSQPCSNSAVCKASYDSTTSVETFTCTCQPGWTGSTCDQSTGFEILSSTPQLKFSKDNVTSISISWFTTLTSFTILSADDLKIDFKTDSNGDEYVSINDINSKSIQCSKWRTLLIEGTTATYFCGTVNEYSFTIESYSSTSFMIGGFASSLPFIGCVRDIEVNGEVLTFSQSLVDYSNSCMNRVASPCSTGDGSSKCNGNGECIDLWEEFKCVCYTHYSGILCNESSPFATFSHKSVSSLDSYREFALNDRTIINTNPKRFAFSIRTRSEDGWVFSIDGGKYCILTLYQGILYLYFDIHSHSYVDLMVADGEFHSITVNFVEYSASNFSAYFTVDGQKSSDVSAKARLATLDLEFLKIKVGVDESSTSSFNGIFKADVLTLTSFKGCVSDIVYTDINSVEYTLPIQTGSILGLYTISSNVLAGCLEDELCSPNPCKNAAICEMFEWNIFRCNCSTDEFVGQLCDQQNFCLLANCPSSTACSVTSNGYFCDGPALFKDSNDILQAQVSSSLNSDAFSSLSFALRTRARSSEVLRFSSNSCDGGSGEFFISANIVEEQLLVSSTFFSDIKTSSVNDGSWHHVLLQCTSQQCAFSMNNVVTNEFNLSSNVDLECLANIFVGGGITNIPMNGCMQNLQLNSNVIPLYKDQLNESIEYFSISNNGGTPGCAGDQVCVSNGVSTCQNNATCQDLWNDYKCDCIDGYEGKNCSVDIDECLSTNQPCSGNGECIDGINSFSCDCSLNWVGEHCSEDVDECEYSVTCQNGANCTNQPGGYNCTCTPEYQGENCTVLVLSTLTCDDDPCSQSRGTCITESSGSMQFRCECFAGYTGTICEDKIDYCQHQNCENSNGCESIISESSATYRCNCLEGYEGQNCSEKIDYCAKDNITCSGRGNCTSLQTTFNCKCTAGFTGSICERDIDECQSLPCVNGDCKNTIGSFFCNCTFGYDGDLCDDYTDFCNPTPCAHGNCSSINLVGYKCTCDLGYEGSTCATNIDDCFNISLCEEGSVCEDGVAEFNCNCSTTGFSGMYCNETCIGNETCANNGSCVAESGENICACTEAYSGTLCEVYRGSQITTATAGFSWFYFLFLLLIPLVIIILLIILYIRQKRSEDGTYRPSQQEAANARLSFPPPHLEIPKQERLI